MLEWIPLTEYWRLPGLSGIYVIRHTGSGKEYVGLSSNVRNRIRSHISPSEEKKNLPLYRAFRKYGKVSFEVCCYVEAAAEILPRMERDIILARGSMIPNGYNITAGGEGALGRRHTEEAKARMRERRLGASTPEDVKARISEGVRRGLTPERRAKISAAGVGKLRSAETRARMGEANRRRPPEHWEKVAEATRSRTVTEAARKKQSENAKNRTEAHRAAISRANTGKTASEETKALMSARKVKPVLAWVPGSMLPRMFPSCAAAAEWWGKPASFVSLYISGRLKTKDGTLFTYE